jgi:hypothetical protein
MSKFDVVMEVARGSEYRTGRQICMQVMGQDRLDAALRAERVADRCLAENEYAHASSVTPVIRPAAAVALAMAA